nr:hypothetical protein [Tanacetum cinerariifolium]
PCRRRTDAADPQTGVSLQPKPERAGAQRTATDQQRPVVQRVIALKNRPSMWSLPFVTGWGEETPMNAQRGVVLIVSLVFLLLLTLLATSSMQNATLQEKVAGSLSLRHDSFQRAEMENEASFAGCTESRPWVCRAPRDPCWRASTPIKGESCGGNVYERATTIEPRPGIYADRIADCHRRRRDPGGYCVPDVHRTREENPPLGNRRCAGRGSA